MITQQLDVDTLGAIVARRPWDGGHPAPLYYQLYEVLRREIEEGRLSAGSQLPTEEELGDAFAVSRTTVREALRALAERGLIEKRQGKRSFVAAAKIGEILPSLSSFSAEMESRGFSVRTNVLDVTRMAPPRRASDALRLTDGGEVLRIVRQRFVDDKPLLVSTSYLSCDISAAEDFSGSLYRLLESRHGITITSGTATVEAGQAGEHESRLLGIDPRAAVLHISWLGIGEDGRPIEYSEATYRGDSYRYVIKLER
jgi:GntR family transcriptional regulator